MAKFETPRAKVTGLGAAGHGAHHFLLQRITALILLILVPFTLWQFLVAISGGYDGVRIWVGSWLGAGSLLVLVTAMFWHLRLGMQVVAEDYFDGSLRMGLLLINAIGCGLLWMISVLSILSVFL